MRLLTTSLILLLSLSAAVADARPRRRSTGSSRAAVPAGHSNLTAQDVAEACAATGRLAHIGGNSGLEGIGMGPSPDAAIRNCCYYGRMRIVDQGVARGRNGQWFACIRGH